MPRHTWKHNAHFSIMLGVSHPVVVISEYAGRVGKNAARGHTVDHWREGSTTFGLARVR